MFAIDEVGTLVEVPEPEDEDEELAQLNARIAGGMTLSVEQVYAL